MIRTALVSGALAGLAGAVEVTGLKGYLTLDLSPGFGYGGIVVAMLAQLHPLGVVAGAIFVAGIFVGSDAMSRGVSVPTYISDVIVAISLICMLLATLLVRYRIRRG
jgi:simple sugar transport system permease protein